MPWSRATLLDKTQRERAQPTTGSASAEEGGREPVGDRVDDQQRGRAAAAIRTFIAGRTLGDYKTDLMLRSAVERQFEILGEALSRALRLDPGLQERLAASRGAIDFRNVIAHEHDALAAATVWDIACNELPGLATDAASELSHLEAERR